MLYSLCWRIFPCSVESSAEGNFRVNTLINARYKWLARDLIYIYIPKPLTFDNIHKIMSQSNFTSSTIYTNFVFRVSASAASNTGYDLALFYQVIM